MLVDKAMWTMNGHPQKWHTIGNHHKKIIGVGLQRSQWIKSSTWDDHLRLSWNGRLLLFDNWREEQIPGLGKKEVWDKQPKFWNKETPNLLYHIWEATLLLLFFKLAKNVLFPC